MADRTIISKIKIGSHLYGTNRPESDLDFSGVFLPSENDLFGLQACPGEMSESIKVTDGPRNGKGDVDCKFYSIQRFINLAAQGQPGQLELLFAPESMYEALPNWEGMHPDWEEILANRDLFLSKNSVWPFVGFALAQAHKTTIKGENLNALRAVHAWGASLSAGQRNEPMAKFLFHDDGGTGTFVTMPPSREGRVQFHGLDGFTFDMKMNDHGYITFYIAGRQFDTGTKIKTFFEAVNVLLGKYGTRSEAAAADGLDFKSLMHAYRLMGQAEELLTEGKITLPRPPAEVKFLMEIRNKQIPEGHDWLNEISSRVDNIKLRLAQTSSLPEKPNWSKLGELCRAILSGHIMR